jgi:ribonuclease P protein component
LTVPPKRRKGTLGFAFPKTNRLLKRREFQRLKNQGTKDRVFLGSFTVFFSTNGLAFNRLGITVTKKVGKANVRNKLKREAREFFRTRNIYWPQGVDFVFRAKSIFGSKEQKISLSSLKDSKEEYKLKRALDFLLKKKDAKFSNDLRKIDKNN